MFNKYFNILIFSVLILAVSCSENKKNAPEINSFKSSILLFGVGYDEGRAQTDLNSVFYAFRQGVIYRFSGDRLTLSLDYSNKTTRVSVEDLTYARLVKPIDNFYIYELPYSGTVNIRGGSEKRISTSLTLKKPFSYLMRMLTIAVIEELGKTHKKDEKGYIYLVSLNYGPTSDKSLVISADLLLTREDQ